MTQQFSENEEPNNTGSTERMSADEAREVIDLWLARRDPSMLSDSPSVPDVAEGLDITPEQTQMLLTEVRARRVAQEAQTRQEAEQANLQMLAAELMRRQDENTQRILETVRAETRRKRSSNQYRERVLLTLNTYPEVRAFGWKGFTNEAKADEENTSELRAPSKTGILPSLLQISLVALVPLLLVLMILGIAWIGFYH